LQIAVTPCAGATLIAVRGDLDAATEPQLTHVLSELARTDGRLVLDLRELSFIDASGLRLLLRADAHARRNGRQLSLIAGHHVTRLLDLCHLRDHFHYAEPPPQ
jgi:anti-anti-sigma factor